MLATWALVGILAAGPEGQRLFYAVDDAAGVASLLAHGAAVDVLAPQVLTLEADGSVAGAEEWAGVQFDFERIPAAARHRYCAFVRAAGAVWYEDVRSVGERLALVRRHALRGFSAWVLGQEDPALWTLLDGDGAAGTASSARGRRCD